MFPVGCLRLALDIVVPPPGTTIGPATAGATLDVSVWNLDPLHHDVQVEIECVTGLLTLSGSRVLTLPANAVPTSVPGGPPGAVIQFSLGHAGSVGGTETLMCRSYGRIWVTAV